MSQDRLPPLTALRAFEAAARHMSFARAAQELSVTPAALSFQIKSLEEHLGTPVFRRLNRAVELTDAGRALAPGTTDAFETLTQAWRRAQRQLASPVLTVTAGPAFTALWLAPRMFDFAQAHPEIELRFTATLRSLDFDRDRIDVAVRYSTREEPDLHGVDLGSDATLPVMRPDVAASAPDLDTLARLPLLADASLDFLDPAPDWATWFRAAGGPVPPSPAAAFSQADHALDAALAGGGAVLARSSLARPLLAAGRLVAPFPVALGVPARFRFLCRKGEEDRPAIAALRGWLTTQMTGGDDPLSGMRVVPVSEVPAS